MATPPITLDYDANGWMRGGSPVSHSQDRGDRIAHLMEEGRKGRSGLDLDDIERALYGPYNERRDALMRVMGATFNAGWDACEEETRKFLASDEAKAAFFDAARGQP